MQGFEITGPYLSALLMSLGALCAFIWGVLAGGRLRAEGGLAAKGCVPVHTVS